MKVKIELTVDIDVDAWILNYGVERNEVRNDVKLYCEHIIDGQLENVGVLDKSE